MTAKPWWKVAERDRLRAIVATLTEVQCKYVADVYDIIEISAGVVGVVEEQLTGPSLADWSASASRDETEVLKVLLQMTGALAALHAGGLSPPSLDEGVWSFDTEGLLNLSVFTPKTTTSPGEVLACTPVRAASDVRTLARLAQELGARHLARLGAASKARNDAALLEFWRGAPHATSTAQSLHDSVNAALLRDQHRAVVIYRGNSAELNAARRTLRVAHPTAAVADATIHYDGTTFQITASSGEVFLNNVPVAPPVPIPGSCVITLGGAHRSWNERFFVTFDASHPEVVF